MRSRGGLQLVGPISLGVVLACLLWPGQALAWGPLAHLNFSAGALESLSLFGGATRAILSRFSGEFLYGSLAADIVVGKNLSRYAVHCHNWRVGFSVLDRAKSDAQRAFSLGFLAHLAVDTVAHNYYVPYKTVEGYHTRANGHAYWELRYDQRLSPDLWKVARDVTHRSFRQHDQHLERCLAESHVLPFSISKKMFGSLLLAARLKKWQRMSQLLASDRELPLCVEETRECEKLAIAQVVGMLMHGPSAPCTRADPTGGRNLFAATQLRTALRKRADLSQTEVADVLRRMRPAFREAIHGRLSLPDLPDRVAA